MNDTLIEERFRRMRGSRDNTACEPVSTGSMTLARLIHKGVSLLSAAGVDHAEQETSWILEFAFDMSRLLFHLNGQRKVSPEGWSRAMTLLERRAAREPLQHLLGTQEFCGLEFEVGPEVFIPRPETELVVEEVRRHCLSRSYSLIADIGTGSGCIAVTLAQTLSTARLYAVDLSERALGHARRNAIRHAVSERVTYLEGDLFEPLRGLGLEGKLAAAVSNPPYIADDDVAGLSPEVRDYEPRLALTGGPDGLTFYRRLLPEALEFLEPGGLLVLEVGQGQACQVHRMALDLNQYASIRTVIDRAGIERVMCLEKNLLRWTASSPQRASVTTQR
jgi:release factor glutamine methyltransferase